MMDENRHSETGNQSGDVFGANNVRAQDDLREQRDPLHHQLVEDGMWWRTQHAPTVEQGSHLLQTRLRTWLDTAAGGKQAAQIADREAEVEEELPMDQHAGRDTSRRTGHITEGRDAMVREPRPPSRRLQPQSRRILATALVASILLFAVVGTVIILRHPQATRGVPEGLYTWLPQASYDSKTPQDAFAASMKLTPCDGAPARTVTVTWLDAGPNYGLALIRVTCLQQERPYAIWLSSLGRDAEQHWSPQAGIIVSNRNAGNVGGSPAQASSTPAHAVQTPSWLSLPPDVYSDGTLPGPKGLQPEASVVAWYSPSRTYVLGHVADQATKPSNAASVVVNGNSGWATEQNGVVIVTLPLADGTTVFFAGTGPVSQIEGFAARAFAHRDEVLTPLTR